MQSMVPLPTTRLVLALLALLVTPHLQLLRWAIPLALFALAVIMAHPLLLVLLMRLMAIQPLDAHLVLPASLLQIQPQVRHLFLRVLFALQVIPEQ